MNEIVCKVVGRWRGADGATAEVIYDGPGSEPLENWSAVNLLRSPAAPINTELELSSGRRIPLPTTEIACLLPDRSGVLAIFENSGSTGGAEQRQRGQSAAIFNADGTLRFMLEHPDGDAGIFRAMVPLTLPDGSRGLGVRACPRTWPVCESVYIVDGSTPEIGTQLPLWVRD